MTMYGVPPGSVATSRTRTTCSLRILIAARPSRRNRATSAGSFASSGSRNLIATRSSSWRCVAARTMPMPPRPSTRSMRYLSARTSLAAGIRSALAMTSGKRPLQALREYHCRALVRSHCRARRFVRVSCARRSGARIALGASPRPRVGRVRRQRASSSASREEDQQDAPVLGREMQRADLRVLVRARRARDPCPPPRS